MMSSSSLVQDNLLNGVQVTQRRLGAGSFGSVFLGTWHGRYVAVKRLHPTAMGLDENGRPTKAFVRFTKELPILQQLSHPSIVQVFGMAPPPAHDASHGLVMELLPVTLRDRYQQEPQLTDDQEISIMTSLASGLQYLHHKGILHRDLTTSNVMMVEWAGCESMPVPAKIIDAGVARVLADVGKKETMTLTPGAENYMAPEARTECHDQKVEYGYPADVYSLGLVVMAMCNRREPPPIASLVVNGRKSDLALIKRLSPYLYCFVSKCVEEDPSVRPTCLRLCEELAPFQKPYSAASASQRSGDRSVTYTDDDVAPLRDKLHDVTKELDTLSRDKVQLTGDLSRATAACEQAIREREEAIKEREEAVTEANAVRDRAVKACQDQSTLVLQLSAERDELDVQLASARTEHGEVAAKYQELVEERNQLQQQIGITKEHGEAKYQDLVEECDRLQGQIRVDKEELDQMSAENTELTKKHYELKEEYDRQQKNLVAKEAEVGIVGEECRELVAEHDQLVIQNGQQLFDTIKERDRAIAVSQDQCKLVNQLSAERDSISTERDQLAAESRQHEEQLAASRVERDRAIAVSQDQGKLVDQLTAERDNISAERDEMAAQNRQYQEQLAAVRAENELSSEHTRTVSRLTTTEQLLLASACEDVTKLQATVQAQGAQMQDLATTVRQFTASSRVQPETPQHSSLPCPFTRAQAATAAITRETSHQRHQLCFDQGKCSKNITLSNDGKRATHSGRIYANVTTTDGYTTGIHQWSMKIRKLAGHWYVGAGVSVLRRNRDYSTAYPFFQKYGAYYWCSNGVSNHYNDGHHKRGETCSKWKAGDVITFTLDCEQRTLQMLVSHTGKSVTSNELVVISPLYPTVCIGNGSEVELC